MIDRWGLVMEHVHPIRNLVEDLLREAASLAVCGLEEMLRDGLASEVITKAEDAQFTRARVAIVAAAATDPWHRYRLAGIEVGGSCPLEFDVEWTEQIQT